MLAFNCKVDDVYITGEQPVMQQLIKFIFSPLAFALGFLWPLTTQLLIAGGVIPSGWTAIAVGAAIAIPWGVMAQIRGSWIWIK